jgi:SAM-dependent methyltransferase
MSAVSDQRTADAFATSWNHLPEGSVYSPAQFTEWLEPLTRADVEGQRVLELGCGGGNLMTHMAGWRPAELIGVDLGASTEMAELNLLRAGSSVHRIIRADLVTFRDARPFDLVYCIGVLHHLEDPGAGFGAVLENTRSGGRFHCWVYAREGNAVIRWIVDPLRHIASVLPWWFTKFVIATPLVVPFFLYAKTLRALRWKALRQLPLYDYSLWIAQRGFGFFRHVAFDQLVAPRTAYLRREMIDGWLSDSRVRQGSTYVFHRNGNSWKFGGIRG